MIDLAAIRERHAAEAILQDQHLRIGWRSHLEIGQLLHEIDRLTLIAREIGHHDPRVDHVRERNAKP